MEAGVGGSSDFRGALELLAVELVASATDRHQREVAALQTTVRQLRSKLDLDQPHPADPPARHSAPELHCPRHGSKGNARLARRARSLDSMWAHAVDEGCSGPPGDGRPGPGQGPEKRGTLRQTTSFDSLADTEVSDIAVGDDAMMQAEHIRRNSSKSSGGSAPMFSLRSSWDLDEARMETITQRAGMRTQRSLILSEVQLGHRRSRCVVHPQSRGRLCWDFAAVALLFFDFVVIPLQVLDMPDSPFLTAMEWVGMLYWSLDVAASLVTGAYINGLLVLERGRILRHYARTWMPFDLTLVVGEYLMLALGSLLQASSDGGGGGTGSVGLVRLLRGGRLTKALRFMRLLRILKVEQTFSDLRARINNNLALLVLSVCRLLVGIVVMIHVLACLWYAIGRSSSRGWVHRANIVSEPLGKRYLYTFQWSMARLHPSTFGEFMNLETDAERVAGIVVSLAALGGGGAFVSSITNTMAQLAKFRHQRTRKLWVVQQYVREHGIPVQLAVRVKKYVEKVLSTKLHEQNEQELQEVLPTTLMTDLRFEAWMPFISGADYFHGLCHRHPRAVWCLCRDALRECSLLHGDRVFATGDVCSHMHFVSRGRLTYAIEAIMGTSTPPGGGAQLRGRDDECLLAPGQAICEAALWTVWTSVGQLSAAQDSTCLALSAERFLSVINGHDQALPEAAERGRAVDGWLNANRDSPSDILPAALQHGDGDGSQAAVTTPLARMIPSLHRSGSSIFNLPA